MPLWPFLVKGGQGYFNRGLYRKERSARRVGMSERAAAVHFGVSRASVKKIMEFSIPSGYRRTANIKRTKLGSGTSMNCPSERTAVSFDSNLTRSRALRIAESLESLRDHIHFWQSLRSMERIAAHRRNASAFRFRHSLSLPRRRQRLRRPMIRLTTRGPCLRPISVRVPRRSSRIRKTGGSRPSADAHSWRAARHRGHEQ